MREDELRRVLLVQAIEEADRDGTLVPLADLAFAGREAMRHVPGPASEEQQLVARAGALLERLGARHPVLDRLLALLDGHVAVTAVLVVLGVAMGASLSLFDGTRRINVLAFPLMGIVGWNLAVYAMLAWHALRTRNRPPSLLRTFVGTAYVSVARRLATSSAAFSAPLAGALRAFLQAWLGAVRPLLLARAGRALHLAAAAAGVGLVAALYVRGIAFEYRAGWESTFLDATGARRVLELLYGPASALAGIPLPDAAALEAARWHDGAGGAPAAPWIHLMAVTTMLYVVVPRVALALAASVRAWRLASHAPLPSSLAGYHRKAFASVEGALPKTLAIVMPFACDLSSESLARLIAWIPSEVGGPTQVEAREAMPYGEEERYLATFSERGGEAAGVIVLPFSLASTPEEENHGIVLAGLRDRLARAGGRTRLLVVVDEAAYAARMTGAPERVAERREAWRRFVAAHGLEARFVRLAP